MEGDIDLLSMMLTDDVVHISDRGPDHHAARQPIVGHDRVTRLFVNIARREICQTDKYHYVTVNGQRASYVVREGEPLLLAVLSWRGNRVAEAIAIVNPDKLRRFHQEWLREQSPMGQ
jgi:RNA polymerase sigma-70 factor (ECF subfamily)